KPVALEREGTGIIIKVGPAQLLPGGNPRATRCRARNDVAIDAPKGQVRKVARAQGTRTVNAAGGHRKGKARLKAQDSAGPPAAQQGPYHALRAGHIREMVDGAESPGVGYREIAPRVIQF